MASSYWDEQLAARYRDFRFDFSAGALKDRVVVVAGGTGGLGAATVALLAREGARLVVGYRSNRQRAEALHRAMQQQFGATLTFVEGELANAAVRQAYLDAIASLGAPLSAAAIFPGDPARAKFESLDRDTLLASLEANYVGPVLLARDLGALLQPGETGGSLVLLATMQAVAPFESSLNYAAPKAALVHAARILARQWSRVRVNVVAPGATVAGMAEASVSAGKYDAFVSNGVIPRFGRPEDVARAVRFFLEPDNYVTGQVLVVDGGLTIRR
jgi:NAD(P)-dependent dehydrogenase (short-subunit alcohol dehydrogenase family)